MGTAILEFPGFCPFCGMEHSELVSMCLGLWAIRKLEIAIYRNCFTIDHAFMHEHDITTAAKAEWFWAGLGVQPYAFL